MEELWKCVTAGEDLGLPSVEEDTDTNDELMAISVQALNGTEGSKTIRLRGHLQGREVFILVDSGSSHSFISEKLVPHLDSSQQLSQPVQV